MSHSLLDTPSIASPDGVKSMKKKTTSPRGISPSKRGQLMNMSPNVSKKTVQLNITTPRGGTIQSRESRLPSRLQRPQGGQNRSQEGQNRSQGGQNSLQSRSQTSAQTQSSHPQTQSHSQSHSQSHPQKPIPRPMLKKPMSLYRSQTSIAPKSLSSSLSLRRTNSFNEASANSSNQTDRFIPSSHNSITKKLDINHTTPHPNASPHTHIKAQSSKIYQKHVAEACGLDTTSRILQFQPLPPERKKPVNLFSSVAKNTTTTSNPLNPTLAFARAKKIPSAPERVLDAPGLVDDFYLNLLTWSLNNLLAIGLEDTVYVWNASTGSVGLLCELANKASVTSLRWSDDGSYISIGRDDGFIEIWDIETNTKLRTLNCDNHLTRIASQAWNQHILTSGSRFGTIYDSDVRIPQHFTCKLDRGHVAEVCGLEYKPDGSQFASGGNDNLVCIWDVRQQSNNNQQPLFSKNNHKAAVKSLLWCPYQLNVLVTGGGSCDKTINFWNTATGGRVNTIETESQISSLNWGYSSGTGMEVVATHGFPNNNISLFHYPTLQKTGDINQAHDSRILSGCLSPDSLTLATVAGDENLKFWSLFDLKGQKEEIEEIDDTKRIKKMMNLR